MSEYRLADEVRRHAAKSGNSPALSDSRLKLTYAELNQRTNRVANVLLDLGIEPGQRIGILGQNRVEVVETALAAAKIGAVAVPLNWRLPAPELRQVITDSDAVLIVCDEQYRAVLAETAAPRLLVFGGNAGSESYEARLDAAPATDPGHRGSADDVVLQLYTSGTTGTAKGVLTTNVNLGACTQAGEPWGFDNSSVSLCAMPLFHIGGLGWLLVGLAYGAHNVLLSNFSPDQLRDVMIDEKITNAFLVPTVISMLTELPAEPDRRFTALRAIAYGSSPITPALLRRAKRLFDAPLFQVYGLTETHGAVTQLDAEDHSDEPGTEHLLTSVGRPYPWVEIKIIDPAGQSVVPGEAGEICVRSLQATRGYFRRAVETAQTISPDSWLRTGDAGRFDEDGYLYVTDRIKDMIITGGENVYPTEVEAVLANYPGVSQVAVVGLPDPRWGETVTAFVVPTPGRTLDPESINNFVRGRLAGYKCPKSIHIMESLPLGPTGKILKRELRQVHSAV